MDSMDMTENASEMSDWQSIVEQLSAPFNPEDVSFRPQITKKGEDGPGARVRAVCYIDARVVSRRLDEVLGITGWSFTFEPMVMANDEIKMARGRLTVRGATKEDIGEASTFSPSKGCISDLLKRLAVHVGVGRYLYDVESRWVTLDQWGNISDEDEARLRRLLPTPKDYRSGATHARRSAEDDGMPVIDDHQGAPASALAQISTPTARSTNSRDGRHKPVAQTHGASAPANDSVATEQQRVAIRKLCVALGKPEPENSFTYAEARQVIAQLGTEYQQARRAQ